MKWNKNIERIIAITLIIILWSLYSFKNKDFEEQQNLYAAANDSIETWKTKSGANMAKISVLETRNSKDFLKLKTKDSTIQELQNIVRKNKKLLKKQGAVLVIKGETKIDTIIETVVISSLDSVFPTYKSSVKTKWYEISSIADQKNTKYEFKTFSNLSLVIGLESQGLFKKAKPYGIATDKNPHTNIKDMRIYQVSLPDKKTFSMAPSLNLGTNPTGQIFITAGISLQFNKLSIKF